MSSWEVMAIILLLIFLPTGFILGVAFSEFRVRRAMRQERVKTVRSIAEALDKD